MRKILVVSLAILGASLLSFPAVAQQKTVKACQEEWRANKDANQAKGITQKAYVAQCRAGGSTTTTAAPAAPSPEKKAAKPEKKKTAAAPPAAGEQKTAKACRDEWRANKADNQAKGITEKAYVAQCRSGGTATAPAPAPAPAQTRTTTAPAQAPAPSAPPATTGARPAATAPTGANQYTTEGEAKLRCFAGTVVWANLDSKIYHFTGYKDYGNTKTGAYMCERDATSQGMRAAKNEKHP
jgi:hypothetical protein